MAQIKAAVAVILDEDKSKVYITFRQKHQTYSNYWEFPGGKLEDGESFEECLKREVYEEIGVSIRSLKPYLSKKHKNQDDILVNLEFFLVEAFKGVPEAKENQELKLVSISELHKFKFLPASLDVIDKLKEEFLV